MDHTNAGHYVLPKQWTNRVLTQPTLSSKASQGIPRPPNFLPRHQASLNWKTKPSQSGTQITKDDGDMEQVLVTGIGGFLKWGSPQVIKVDVPFSLW